MMNNMTTGLGFNDHDCGAKNLPEQLISILKLRCRKNQDECALSRDF